jgi:hypothetical protein
LQFNDLSERFAFSTKLGADEKPLAQCFGWVVEDGAFKPGLLYNSERVRVKTLAFELYEPGEDNAPVYLGQVKVKLADQLSPCGDGEMHTGLELGVLSASRA